MKETIKLGLTLLLISAISGAVLAATNSFTGPIIDEIRREGSFGALMEIFPDADDFQPIEEGELEEIQASNGVIREVNQALEGDTVVGYSFKVVTGGYGGDIATMVGIYEDGTMAGIKVVENSETPNLGTKIEEESFSGSFKDKSTEAELLAVDNPSAENEVQMISGATVSTDAVVKGVNGAREAFVEYFSN